MDGRRPLLVNDDEIATDEALRQAAEERGYRVFAKARVADALGIDRSGISSEAFSFALRAHFDWLVADAKTTRPEFAVEFDGDSHEAPEAMRRDALKDEICERLGLPLLRVDRAVLRPTAQHTVLGYLVSSWDAYKGFYDAQERGDVPPDEIFMPWAVIDAFESNGWPAFRDITGPGRRFVERLFYSGLLTTPIPSDASRDPSRDDPNHAEAFAWVQTREGPLVTGHARVRAYSFQAVSDCDLAEDLAILDLVGRLARLTEGDRTVLIERAIAGLPVVTPGSGWNGGEAFVIESE